MKSSVILVLVLCFFGGCYGGAWKGRQFLYPKFPEGVKKTWAEKVEFADYRVYVQSTSVRPVKNGYLYQIDVLFYRSENPSRPYAKFRRYIVAKDGPIDINGEISESAFSLELKDRNTTELWGINFRIGAAPEYLPEIVTQEGIFRR